MTIQRVSSVLGTVKGPPAGRGRSAVVSSAAMWRVSILAIAFLAACGGKIADDFTRIDVGSSSSASSSGSASSPSSSGSTYDPCRRPSPGPCGMRSDEGAEDAPESAAVVTDVASCKTSLYLTLTTKNGRRLRRYDVESVSGPFATVVLLDKSFPAVGLGSQSTVAANSRGHVYVAGPSLLARIVDQNAIPCTGIESVPGTPGSITIASDGTTAYAVFDADTLSGVRVFAIAPTGERGCSVSSFPREGGPTLAKQRGIALDGRGRVHVAAGTSVAIYERSGKFARSYGPFETLGSITSCKGGLCIDELGSVRMVDEDGTFSADLPYKPSAPLGGLIQLVGDPFGPLLLVGQNDETKGTSVDVIGVP